MTASVGTGLKILTKCRKAEQLQVVQLVGFLTRAVSTACQTLCSKALTHWLCCYCHHLQEQQVLFEAMRAQGMPLRYTHCMASFMPEDEFSYAARLVSLAGAVPQTHSPCTCSSSGLDGQAACSCEVNQQDPEQQQQQQQQGSDALSMHVSQQEQGAGAALHNSAQQRQQQQAGPPDLVEMPAWLKDLAVLTAGNILSRPDTFRCVLAQASRSG
jgi:hypothetical protein